MSRSVRPEFGEPWRLEDLRARYDYHLPITGPEARLFLGWSRSKLRSHHQHHPERIPKPLAKGLDKGWNHYWLGEVLDAIEEETLWQLKQRLDERPLSEVQRRNREAKKEREREIQRISAVATPWIRGAKFSTWVSMARADDEWPMVKRKSGVYEDFFETIGTTQPGDRVAWVSLRDYLTHVQTHITERAGQS